MLAKKEMQIKFCNGIMFVYLNFVTSEPYEIFLMPKIFQTMVYPILILY